MSIFMLSSPIKFRTITVRNAYEMSIKIYPENYFKTSVTLTLGLWIRVADFSYIAATVPFDIVCLLILNVKRIFKYSL